jgi:hypothetical protein
MVSDAALSPLLETSTIQVATGRLATVWHSCQGLWNVKQMARKYKEIVAYFQG